MQGRREGAQCDLLRVWNGSRAGFMPLCRGLHGFVGVDKDVEGAGLIQEGEEGDRCANLADDGLDLGHDALRVFLGDGVGCCGGGLMLFGEVDVECPALQDGFGGGRRDYDDEATESGLVEPGAHLGEDCLQECLDFLVGGKVNCYAILLGLLEGFGWVDAS